jgi:5-methyltetrahydrofolate--homocysteine methyltransferase
LLEAVKLNSTNIWYSRLIKITEYAAKRAKGYYHIAMTDIGGVLDILSSFLGPTKLILAMKRNPAIIDTCRAIILEKILKLFNILQGIIEKYNKGCNAWLNVWCRKRWYPVQCDFIAMLNPKWFRRFALPDIITQIEHLDYAIYHMDGPYQIPFLDDFLKISRLTGIQWVPGSGNALPGSGEWIPLYKKIQKAGKNIVIDTLPQLVPYLYKSLDAKGLYVRTFYVSKNLINFYLPDFMGGQDARLINEAVKWAKEIKQEKLNIQQLDVLLIKKSLTFDDKIKGELLREINSVLRGSLALTFT